MSPLKLTFLFFLIWSIFPTTSHAQLYINECMASNDIVIADEFGEYDDWIEIYNAGTSDIDLAGYYFTDDINTPTLWQIPANSPSQTTVPAGSFLILWADKDLDQGAHHINIKLSANGETVQLFAPDGNTLIDEVTFGTQNANVSYGRSSDGGNDFQTFPSPSPNSSNNTLVNSSYTGIIMAQIDANNDDAEELSGGTVKLTSSDLEMTEDGTSKQTVGLRFKDIAIPQGATIEKAYLQFTAYETSFGNSLLNVEGENSDDAAAFQAINFDLTNRTKTNENAEWIPQDWAISDEAELQQQTVDLKSVVQEIINRPGWTSGNALAFFVSGDGVRRAYAHDLFPQRATRLVVEVRFSAPETLVENLYINELASNGTNYTDEFSEIEDWIELYNGSSEAINIGGLYLTDDIAHPTRWQIAIPETIPPGGFAIILADDDTEQGGLHTNFKLGTSGETILLTQVLNNSISIIDSITFGTIPFQASYGRATDGQNSWVTFSEYTPNSSNNNSTQWLSPPLFSIEGGNYPNAQNLILSHPVATAQIRYTTDGSEPTASSSLYSSSILVDENQGVRARAFLNAAESAVETQAFLIAANTNMASVFISTDPDNFFDDEIGIYVEGTNGVTEYCNTTPKNWAQDWERPMHISLFETDGSQAFGVNAGVQIGGACSRNFVMKSLNVYLRKNNYGDADIGYSLFEERDFKKYTRFKLRNSGQDFVRMGFRDGLIQKIIWNQVDIDLQAFRPVTVFLNGDFFGIHNIRENFNDEYFEDFHGVKTSDLDLIKSPSLDWQEIKKGTDIEYAALYDFIDNNDLSVAQNYTTVEEQIDINEFLNYWISMIYTANYDWPANNIVVWKERKNNKKWRWALLDADGSTNNGLSDQADASFNTLAQVTDTESVVWPNHRNSTLFLRKLLENSAFRDEFVQRGCSFIELIFNEDRVTPMTDEIKNLYESEIDNHFDKWGDGNALGGDIWSWYGWVDAFKAFFVDRPDFYRNAMDEHFNLNGTYTLTVDYNANTGGDVFVNSNKMAIPYDYQGLYFKNVPLELTAVAQEGFQFSHWEETGETNPEIQFIANGNATITPIFMEINIAVDLGADLSICRGDAVLIEAIIESCDGCSYEWNDGFDGSSRELSPMVSTNYSITITDANNNSASDDLSITVNDLPNIASTVSSISCPAEADGMINLNLTGGAGNYSYQWTNGFTDSDLTDLGPGMYGVTVTDANNCQASENFNLTEPPTLVLTTDEVIDVNCFSGNDGSISIDLSQGAEPYQINWSNNATGATINQLTAGSYTVSITESNNCQTVENFTIEQPTALTVNSNSQFVSCFTAQDGAITVEVHGGIAPYDFLWNNGADSQNLDQISGGDYQLTISDQNNCSFILSVEVDEPEELTAALDVTSLSCSGTNDASIDLTVNGGTSPYHYLWSNAAISEDLDNLIPGTYSVTITDAHNCQQTNSATIGNVGALETDVDVSQISCHGANDGALFVSVSGGVGPYDYLWSNNSSNSTIAGLPAGDYILTISDVNNCQSISTYTLEEPELLTGLSEITNISCFDLNNGAIDLTVLGGTAPFDFMWSNMTTDEDPSNLSPGLYDLSITDHNNCSFLLNGIEIEEPTLLELMVLSTTPPMNGNDGSIEVSASGGIEPYQFDWSNNETGPTLNGLSAGTFQLTLTDANGCTQEESVLLETTSTHDWNTLNHFVVYPNPNAGLFYLDLHLNIYTAVNIKVYNALGQVVSTFKEEGQQLMIPVDLSHQAKGIYWVQLETEDGRATRRVIVD